MPGHRATPTVAITDFDLHGVVGLRLLDSTAADRATVSRQTGLVESALDRTPDVVIRFVEAVPSSGQLRLLGPDVGFDRQSSLTFRSKWRPNHGAALIPLHEVGGRCELFCEQGLAEIPLLMEIVNLTALAKGHLPLHAAAFLHGPVGTVVTGWSKGGKTETLLASMWREALFVGDEWVYLTPEGRQVLGSRHPIRLWDWQLRQFREFRRRLSSRQRRRLDVIRAFRSMHRSLSAPSRRLGPLRILDRMAPSLEQAHGVHVDPVTVFGADRVRPSCSFDRLFYAESRSVGNVEVRPIEPAEVAARMRFSLQYERRELTEAYLKFRFAFPSLRNSILEEAPEIEREALLRAFSTVPAYLVAHPYPVRIKQLWERIGPFL
jgi:hypothetical protein